MRRMLQAEVSRDYVIATGEAHTVQDVCETAFGYVGVDWRNHVAVSDRPERDPDRVVRVGDSKRAAADLGWVPTLDFTEMIIEMVDADAGLLNASRPTDSDPHVLTD
jgi:GDPmannose 4,6-dehydratase